MSIREIQAGKGGIGASLARVGLHVLSWGYGVGVAVRELFLPMRKPKRLSVPVICVGNIAAGGTGKTPFVIWLARALIEAGLTPGILARGYGDKSAVHPALNDEGAVIRDALPDVPQLQHADRYAAGVRLLQEHPRVDVILLDDGFQHRRLHRDLDIVLLDGLCPFGYGYLLPRGLLRESRSALARAGAVVVTRAERLEDTDLGQLRVEISSYTAAPVAVAETRPKEAADLQGVRVLACCGLGNPDAFLGTLADLGAEVVGRRLLADHETLSEAGWKRLIEKASALDARVVTTAKDAVKVAHLPRGIVVVEIELDVVEGRDELWRRIEAALGR